MKIRCKLGKEQWTSWKIEEVSIHTHAHTHTHRCVCSRWKLPGSFSWERRTRCKRRSTWWDKRKRSCNWRRCNCCKRANCPPWSDNDASPWPGRLSSKLRWSEFARTPGRNRWSAVIAEIWRTAFWRCVCSRWRSSIFDLSLLKGLRRRPWNRNPRRICRTIFFSSNFVFHLSTYIRYILSTGVFSNRYFLGIFIHSLVETWISFFLWTWEFLF